MFDTYIESGKESIRYLKNYHKVAVHVKEMIHEFDEYAEVYVFGSVVEGRYTASSDIDILIISDRIPREKRAEIKAKIRGKIGIQVPIQLHIATREEYNKWYRRFITTFQKI